MTKKTESRWLAIKEGDVVKAPSGMLRVVRSVSRAKNNRQCEMRKVHVTFTIQRCSWTRRPYTIYNLGELHDLGYKLTDLTWPLKTEFDRLFAEEYKATRRDSRCRGAIPCCAVKGIA
jgi:hypothetical protein